MCGMKGLRFEHACLVMSDSQLEFKMIWRNGSERESSHRRHEPRVAVPKVVIIAGLHRGKVKKSLLPLDSIDVNCCIVVMCRKYLLSWLHYLDHWWASEIMKDMKAGASKMLVDLSYWKSRLGNDLGLSLERMVEAELCRNQLLRGAGGGVCLILCIMTCLLVHYIIDILLIYFLDLFSCISNS